MIMSHSAVLRIGGLKLGVGGYRSIYDRLLVLVPLGGLCRACWSCRGCTNVRIVTVMVTVT